MQTEGSGPDLHVVRLRYALQPSDRITYVSPAPVGFETADAFFRLAEGNLACDMKTHFPTQDAARAVVEPVLRAWEVDADLRWIQGALRFKFDRAEIIDRSPVPPGDIRVFGTAPAPALLAMGGTVSVHETRCHYPAPPCTFRLNPDAESILRRYQDYLGGREPLPSMAYFCLTVFEATASDKNNRRKRAAKAYGIEKLVLDTIGELASRPGDRSSARKAAPGPVQPITGLEGVWLEAAVRTLIWRLGDTRTAMTLPLITMRDLPKL